MNDEGDDPLRSVRLAKLDALRELRYRALPGCLRPQRRGGGAWKRDMPNVPAGGETGARCG